MYPSRIDGDIELPFHEKRDCGGRIRAPLFGCSQHSFWFQLIEVGDHIAPLARSRSADGEKRNSNKGLFLCGQHFFATLIQASDGNYYGTTLAGGNNNEGTVFKITPSSTLTTLYSFCAQTICSDGSNPWAGVIQATNGNLYGQRRE
jgi:uncharacterized repeat protein (TIGR03803 family)